MLAHLKITLIARHSYCWNIQTFNFSLTVYQWSCWLKQETSFSFFVNSFQEKLLLFVLKKLETSNKSVVDDGEDNEGGVNES